MEVRLHPHQRGEAPVELQAELDRREAAAHELVADMLRRKAQDGDAFAELVGIDAMATAVASPGLAAQVLEIMATATAALAHVVAGLGPDDETAANIIEATLRAIG